jgi:hypothetical protein
MRNLYKKKNHNFIVCCGGLLGVAVTAVINNDVIMHPQATKNL